MAKHTERKKEKKKNGEETEALLDVRVSESKIQVN